MARHFAVTVRASEVAEEGPVLARRLSRLTGRTEVEVEAALRGGAVILQRDLSYGEAIEFQRALSRRRIPAQVRGDEEIEGVELLLGREDPVEEDGESDGEEADSAWGEFFPELSKEEGEGFEAEEFEELGEFGQSKAPGEIREVKGSPKEKKFDGKRLREAFVGVEEDRPPYQPRGYDRRTEHIPLLAALLTAVAPGAGQIYNGQPERAQSLAVSFVLIYPWLRGVRQAKRYGEQIRTYYKPRPKEGAFARAMVFAAKWWATMGVLIAATIWMVGGVEEYRDRQEAQRVRVELQQLIFYGQDVVMDGVDDAVVVARRAAEEIEEVESGEMEDEERARRLFIIGYHHCRSGEYAMCAAAMGRVTALVRDNRDAFRLHTWASVQEKAEDGDSEMPEVGEVPTLEEFELELSLRGEDLVGMQEDWWDEGG